MKKTGLKRGKKRTRERMVSLLFIYVKERLRGLPPEKEEKGLWRFSLLTGAGARRVPPREEMLLMPLVEEGKACGVGDCITWDKDNGAFKPEWKVCSEDGVKGEDVGGGAEKLRFGFTTKWNAAGCGWYED